MFFENLDNIRLERQLSGNRFTATYRLFGDEKTAWETAADICAEQTVEFPVSLLPSGTIPEKIVGRVETLERENENVYLAEISFAEELAAGEWTQFLNVLFGNISMKPGLQLTAIRPSQGILNMLVGPQFGISGIREIIGVPERPPLFTALKPMGLSAENLADLASQFAEGGVDIIKDDHGLSDQPFSPFEERVARCADAVRNVNAKTGRKAIYVPNVTAPIEKFFDRAIHAKKLGAGAVMVSPGLIGLDAVRRLAEMKIGLPILAHPAWIGGFALNQPGNRPQGMSCGVLYGTLMRMVGADATIFPNYGGRFPLSHEDCMGIVAASRETLGKMRPIFPSPAGGMELKNIRDMIRNYGNDMLVLVGSGLFRCGDNLADNCKRFFDEVR